MDLLQYRRAAPHERRDGFLAWETQAESRSWDDVGAPGQVAARALAAIGRRRPPDGWARPAANVVHWTTGAVWGTELGVLSAGVRQAPWWIGLAARRSSG